GVLAWCARDDERGDCRARPVHVIDTPTPEPRAVALLLGMQPVASARDCERVRSRLRCEHLDDVCGHVGGRWVDDFTEITEGKTRAERARVVDVERSPSAV